jgi:hypothetical protein
MVSWLIERPGEVNLIRILSGRWCRRDLGTHAVLESRRAGREGQSHGR